MSEQERAKYFAWPDQPESSATTPRRLHPAMEAWMRERLSDAGSTAAAREMIHTMQQRRRASEERSARRARWAGYSLCAAAVLLGLAGMVTPNEVVAGVLGALSVACVAMAGGLWLRGRL